MNYDLWLAGLALTSPVTSNVCPSLSYTIGRPKPSIPECILYQPTSMVEIEVVLVIFAVGLLNMSLYEV